MENMKRVKLLLNIQTTFNFKKKNSCLNRSISTIDEVSRQPHLISIICKLIVTICAKVKEGSFNSTGSELYKCVY